MNFKELQGQIAHSMEELSQYDMEIVYRPGKQHLKADALTRMPVKEGCYHYQGKEILSDLPCGGCKYCSRAHLQWHAFFSGRRRCYTTCRNCNDYESKPSYCFSATLGTLVRCIFSKELTEQTGYRSSGSSIIQLA